MKYTFFCSCIKVYIGETCKPYYQDLFDTRFYSYPTQKSTLFDFKLIV